MSDMKDEYGNMDSSGQTFVALNFVLETGRNVLNEAEVCYTSSVMFSFATFGTHCRLPSLLAPLSIFRHVTVHLEHSMQRKIT